MAPNRNLAALVAAMAVLCWGPGAFCAAEEQAPEGKPWGDSPFLAERGGPKTVVTGETGPGEELFVLQGILWDPKSPSAILNDHVVSAGEHLGRWQVLEVHKDRVVISDGSNTREIYAQ